MLKYASGEEIRRGDHVQYDGVPATVDFVVAGPSGDQALDWYVHEHGPGVMLVDPVVFGSVYVPADDMDELLLLSRDADASK